MGGFVEFTLGRLGDRMQSSRSISSGVVHDRADCASSTDSKDAGRRFRFRATRVSFYMSGMQSPAEKGRL
jgi:hypothetical protein